MQMPPPKKRARELRNLKEVPLNDETKENNKLPEGVVIKPDVEEAPSSLKASGFPHSTAILPSRRPDGDIEDVPVEDATIKREDGTSDVALSNAMTASSTAISNPKLAVHPAMGVQSTSHPLSEMQAILGKPVLKSETVRSEAGSGFLLASETIKESTVKTEISDTAPIPISASVSGMVQISKVHSFDPREQATKASLVHPKMSNDPVTTRTSKTQKVLDQAAKSLKAKAGPTTEIEVIKEVVVRDYEVVDLTDDLSPASTLPPSPAATDLESGEIGENAEFSTPLLPLIEKDFRFNFEVLLEIQNLVDRLLSTEIVPVPAVDEECPRICDSPPYITCDSPQNYIESQEDMEEDEIFIIENIYSRNLQKVKQLSTSPLKENVPAPSNSLNTAPAKNILPSSSENLDGLASASPVTLENSSPPRKKSVSLNQTCSKDAKLIIPETVSTELVFPTRMQDFTAAVGPPSAETSLSQSALPAMPRMPKLCATVAPTPVPQTTRSIAPLTYQVELFANNSTIPMEISPPSSPAPEYLSSDDSYTENILKKNDTTRSFSQNPNPPIHNTNLNSTRNLTAAAAQKSSVIQSKKRPAVEDMSRVQPAAKKLDINEYRKRLSADPRRRSSATNSSPPCTNLPQASSAHYDNGNVFSTLRNNIATFLPNAQMQSQFLPEHTFPQFPVHSNTSLTNITHNQHPLQNIVHTDGRLSSSQHQPQQAGRNVLFYAQQLAMGGIASPLPLQTHPSPSPPLLAQSGLGSRQYLNQATASNVVPFTHATGIARASPTNFDIRSPLTHQNTPSPPFVQQSVAPFNSAQTPAMRNFAEASPPSNVQSPLHQAHSPPIAQQLPRAVQHRQPALANPPREPERQIARRPEAHAQKIEVACSVPTSLSVEAVGRRVIQTADLQMIVLAWDLVLMIVYKKEKTGLPPLFLNNSSQVSLC